MATRGRHSKDEPGRNEFTGRVRHWERIWVTSKAPKCKELKFRRWAQTGAVLTQPAGLQADRAGWAGC